MQILHIDSSILGDNSVSRDLSADIVKQLQAAHKDTGVTHYDLAANPVPHLSSALFAAQGKSEAERSPSEKEDVAFSEKIMADFLAADVIVVGAPMYNFGVPSQLKAWIDRIAVAGKTFRYTANGPEGLAGDKRVIIASARGGLYGKDSPNAAADHQESFLQTVFGFVGITDVTFVRAEGVNMGPEMREKALTSAKAQLQLVA